MSNSNSNMSESSVPTISNVTNTAFSDEIIENPENSFRAADIVEQIPSKVAVSETITDKQWMLKDLFAKPQLIKTVSFATGSARFTTLATLKVPEVLLTVPLSIRNQIARTFTFLRGDWAFRFMINATKFHVGRLMAVWVPLDTLAPSNLSAASGFPNVLIDVANASPVEMKIPYFSQYAECNIAQWDDSVGLGTIYIFVLNPLQATTSVSSTVDLSIAGWVENAELRMPIDSNLSNLPVGLRETVPQGIGDFLTDAIGVVESSASAISNVVRGNGANACKDAGSLLKKIPQFVEKHPEVLRMMFDRPTDEAFYRSIPMPFSSYSHGSGAESATRLSLFPKSLHVPDELQMSGHMCDSSISKIAQVPMLVDIKNWTDSQTPGTLLLEWDIAPWNAVGATATVGTQETYLSYVSDFFAYYRGSIRVRFDVVASQFHAGRLLFCYVPGFVSTNAPTLEEAWMFPNVVYDLSNNPNRSFTLECPYVANLPWIDTAENTTPAGTESANRHVSGWLYVYVLNALVHPDNVSLNVEINFYMSGGPDIEFVCPRNSTSSAYTTGEDNRIHNIVPAKGVQLNEAFKLGGTASIDGKPYVFKTSGSIAPVETDPQGLDSTGDGDAEEVHVMQLVKQPIDPPKAMSLEVTNDLRDVMRRYGRLWNSFYMNIPTEQYQYAYIPVTPLGYSQICGSPLSYFSRLFLGWSGSIRYKIICNATVLQNQLVGCVFDPYDFYAYPATFGHTTTDVRSQFLYGGVDNTLVPPQPLPLPPPPLPSQLQPPPSQLLPQVPPQPLPLPPPPPPPPLPLPP